MMQLFAPLALGQHMDVVGRAAALTAIEGCRYFWASVDSTKEVEAPSRAVTHIQNTAPAPPADTAATTPTRLPMPTRVAVETMSV